MSRRERAPTQGALAHAALLAVSFAAFYLYVWLRIDPRLIYHVQGRIFLMTPAFAREFLPYPGGPIEYASAFLTQLHYHPWLGATVLTLVVLAATLLTGVYFRSLGLARSPVLQLGPAVLLLLLHSSHGYPLTTALALVVALAFAVVYTRLPLRRSVPRFVLSGLLAVCLYYLAGGALFLFAVLCIAFDLLERRRILPVAQAVSAILLPLLAARILFEVVTYDAYTRLLPFAPGHEAPRLGALLYAYYPGVALGFGLCRRVLKSEAGTDGGPAIVRVIWRLLRGYEAMRFREALSLLLFVLTAVWLVHFAFDEEATALLEMDRLARYHQWPELLDAAQRNRTHPVFRMDADPMKTVLLIHDMNRALYHTGRLPYDLFAVPQIAREPTLMLSSKEFCHVSPIAFLKRADFLFHLGRVNEAEHMAHEAWATLGDHPSVYRQVALINVAKGRPDAARNVLTALSESVNYRGWAHKYIEALDKDPELTAHKGLTYVRSLMFKGDVTGAPVYEHQDKILEMLLEANPHNRMAFEYLMAYHLLQGNHAAVVANIGRLDDFGYEGIPTLYEQAILLYIHKTGRGDVDLHGRRISDQTKARFDDFLRRAQQFGRDETMLWDALAGTHGNTYWFYSSFGATPLGRQLAQSRPDAYSGATI